MIDLWKLILGVSEVFDVVALMAVAAMTCVLLTEIINYFKSGE